MSLYEQCCGAAAAIFRVEPEPSFSLAEAGFLKAAPAASFWQAKKESRVVVTKHDFRAIYNCKCDLKRLALIIHFIRTQNEKC